MNNSALSTLAAIVIQLALALAVFQANPRRKSNQCFLLLSGVIAVWLGSLFQTLTTTNAEVGAFYIRHASAAGALTLVFFNLLRLTITRPADRWSSLLRQSWIWLVAGFAVGLLCQTGLFLKTAEFSAPGSSTNLTLHPVYGKGLLLYILYFFVAGFAILFSYLRAVRNATALERSELSFILIGAGATLATVGLAAIAGFFVDRARLLWFAPFRIVVFSIVIAFGITTQKIMEVGFVLRRTLSYALLTAYLLALYTIVWWLGYAAFAHLLGNLGQSIAHVTAAIIIAFAMAPARGVSQSLADRLFGGTRSLDFRATVSKAAEILKSVSTLPELLARFATTIGEAVGTDRIVILLRERHIFQQSYPSSADSTDDRSRLSEDDPLLVFLTKEQQPLVLEGLYRARSTPEVEELIARMIALKAVVVTGIFSRQHLVGVMVLGPRRSRRIYGSVEQNALQILCGQLAVAIDNARLFTEVQNAKLYNETLLENLTSGVIAVGADERVTVFNNEAGQITGLDPREVIDRSIENLPDSIRDGLRDTLHSVERRENNEIALQSDQEAVVARASSSVFHGQEGEMLGALMVLTDITALKRLEQQIRRSDRLASLGTLSAGMAHEIKNPLVSIKTFAQLLPERYQDSDFRETFSNLIGHEIDRIDSLVNQLLRFARPAKPLLKPMHVHDVLEKSLMLVGHRLYQKEIKLSRSWNAEVDTIRADADQLEQVFLNFFLNAMDAMKLGGELIVATEIRSAEDWIASVTSNGDGAREILCVTVQDNGEGIKNEDIAHVFDPFFTTKDYGTGLGLSVVHGIIQEHGGEIEVESELANGTSFHILLPLVRFQEEVAAA
ncbi:MAG: ATP-binding protein [Chthoniobacterales bacterium]